MCTRARLVDREFTLTTCYELLPEWKGLRVHITQLSGGLTNRLYRVRSEKGDYTVRIFGDKTELFIDRDHEVHAITEMARLGVCPPLVKYLPEQGVTIVEFIDMFKPFTDIYWLLWSLIQKSVSKIDFDYYKYGGVKYENAMNNLAFIGKHYGVVV